MWHSPPQMCSHPRSAGQSQAGSFLRCRAQLMQTKSVTVVPFWAALGASDVWAVAAISISARDWYDWYMPLVLKRKEECHGQNWGGILTILGDGDPSVFLCAHVCAHNKDFPWMTIPHTSCFDRGSCVDTFLFFPSHLGWSWWWSQFKWCLLFFWSPEDGCLSDCKTRYAELDDAGVIRCSKCPAGTWAPAASVGRDSCRTRRQCNAQDVQVLYLAANASMRSSSICRNNHTNIRVRWRKPKTCKSEIGAKELAGIRGGGINAPSMSSMPTQPVEAKRWCMCEPSCCKVFSTALCCSNVSHQILAQLAQERDLLDLG